MLKEYRDVPNIKNKLGVDVPVFMISINEDVREATIQAMTSKGYKEIYAKEHLQEFIDYVFDFHREKFEKIMKLIFAKMITMFGKCI